MKSRFFLLGTFINVLAFMTFGCRGAPATTTAVSSGSGGLALDTAIEQAAERMENAFEVGTEIALVSVSSPSTQFSEYVLTYLETVLVNNGKLAVVDRSNLDRVREEQGFQLSGEVSDESAKAIGQLLGAGAIVTGGLVNLGDAYRLNLKAINVETARIGASYAGDIAGNPRIQTLLASGGGAASEGGAGRRTQTTQAGDTGSGAATDPVAPAAPTYKIGDEGPAGGLVFYDKGNNSGGWRYLEAAPTDIDRKLYATEEGVAIQPERRAVGTGKPNTQAIMVQANNRGGGFGWAAQACDALEVNGFDDWFLPSRDELHFMYGNLHMRNLGGFNLDWYWSSTYEREYYDAHSWWGENFSDGGQAAHVGNRNANPGIAGYPQQFRIRAVRAF
jgi:hypothetical protein